ncbi:MAG TPA: SURF1 family protein [Alphaproteobacteria bacterium]
MPSSGVLRQLSFRPRLGPTLVTVPLLLALLGLGAWQVARLQEKNAINAYRAQRAAEAPVDLPADPGDLAAFDFHRVRVHGRFAHERELYMYGRSQRGNDGYYLITPLIRDNGPPVLINRGWVPTDHKAPATRPESEPAEPVTVTAFLRQDARHGWLMPDNDPARNAWFWFDLPAMSKAAGLDPPATFYLEADATPNPAGLPVGGQTQIALPSPHLQYAITWFALAIGLIVIYVVWHKQAERG